MHQQHICPPKAVATSHFCVGDVKRGSPTRADLDTSTRERKTLLRALIIHFYAFLIWYATIFMDFYCGLFGDNSVFWGPSHFTVTLWCDEIKKCKPAHSAQNKWLSSLSDALVQHGRLVQRVCFSSPARSFDLDDRRKNVVPQLVHFSHKCVCTVFCCPMINPHHFLLVWLCVADEGQTVCGSPADMQGRRLGEVGIQLRTLCHQTLGSWDYLFFVVIGFVIFAAGTVSAWVMGVIMVLYERYIKKKDEQIDEDEETGEKPQTSRTRSDHGNGNLKASHTVWKIFPFLPTMDPDSASCQLPGLPVKSTDTAVRLSRALKGFDRDQECYSSRIQAFRWCIEHSGCHSGGFQCKCMTF